MKIGNINIGSKTKKEFHDMSHDVNTTSDNGFCQPTLIQPVMANSSISIKTNSFVRLAPMPCPTFGRVKVQTDTMFIPMTEVFEAFNEMMSGNTVYSPVLGGSYAPKNADYLHAGRLLDILFTMGKIDSYGATTFDTDHVDNIFRQFFRFGFYANYDPTENSPVAGSWHDMQKPNGSDFLPDAFVSFLKSANSLPIGYVGDALEGLSGMFSYYLFNNEDPEIDYLSLFQKSLSSNNWFNYLHCFCSYNGTVNTGISYSSVDFGNLRSAYIKMDPSFANIFNLVSTSDNADFVLDWIPEKFAKYSALNTVSYEDNTLGLLKYRFTATLTPFGRRFFKILNSVGINFRFSDAKVEFTKLLAYYKTWFDLYNPNRVLQWKDTNAYSLIHRYFDYNVPLSMVLNPEEDEDFSSDVLGIFKSFILDCSKCVYYLEADPITVATSSLLLKPQGESAPASDVIDQKNIKGQPLGEVIASSPGSYPTHTVGLFNGLSIKMLEKLYYLSNKESVLASNIAEFMLSKFGVNIRSSRLLGRDDFYCQISDIMGTVNNDDTALGEYAGKGIGSGDTKHFKFDVPQQGYIVQLFSVVPYGGYVQANTHPQINKIDFFEPELDSVGLEALPYSEVFARESVINNFRADYTFGFRPYYFGLKYRNNVANGDFSFRSTRSQVLPYSLDRIFSEGNVATVDNSADVLNRQLVNSKPVTLTPTENLRSIGLYETYGNYDRIFYDTTGLTDNYIIHMLQDVKYYAPMKPIRNSFDAYDPEQDDDVKDVNHA